MACRRSFVRYQTLLLCAVLALLMECRPRGLNGKLLEEEPPANTEPSVPPNGSGMKEGPATSQACASICSGVKENAEDVDNAAARHRWAACFSCRCKASIGWFPPPEELRCSSATQLKRYRAKTSHALPESGLLPMMGVEELDPEGPAADECLNGGIGDASCDLRSRFKRIVHGEVEYQMLCRQPTNKSKGYYEYLIIANNAANGATCFWQARNHNFNGEDVASLDVTDAGNRPIPSKVKKYTDTFYLYSTGPSVCTTCHGSDAFIWSPYLHSAYPVPTANELVSKRLSGPYFKVSAESDRLQPVKHRFLRAGPTAPGAPPTDLGCTSCHRVADDLFCDLSMQAIGKTGRAQAKIYEPNSAFNHAKNFLFWMPLGGRDHKTWERKNRDDMNRISECCQEPNPACVWDENFVSGSP